MDSYGNHIQDHAGDAPCRPDGLRFTRGLPRAGLVVCGMLLAALILVPRDQNDPTIGDVADPILPDPVGTL